MHHSRAHAFTKRHLFKFSLCTIIAAIMLALLPAGASSAAPQIEWFPHYRPQTKCSPKPKPGTVMLAKYLMRHYKGSGSLGISRSCGASGISEHKEGRAFDWALNARSRRDRHYAADFLHRMRKTDRYGHRDALARRMGIMYVIWNDHIYSATHRYRTQRYRNSGCKSLKRCSAALRHRNHMHISLTRPAAHERTSWYTRHSAVHSAHKNKKHHRAHHRHHRARHHADHHHRAHHKHHRARHHAHHHRRAHHRRAHHQAGRITSGRITSTTALVIMHTLTGGPITTRRITGSTEPEVTVVEAVLLTI